MLGILDNVIRTATGRDAWDAPATWRRDADSRDAQKRRAEDDLRREILIRSGR